MTAFQGHTLCPSFLSWPGPILQTLGPSPSHSTKPEWNQQLRYTAGWGSTPRSWEPHLSRVHGCGHACKLCKLDAFVLELLKTRPRESCPHPTMVPRCIPGCSSPASPTVLTVPFLMLLLFPLVTSSLSHLLSDSGQHLKLL